MMELISISRHYGKIDNQKSSKWLNNAPKNVYDQQRTKKLTDEELNRFERLVKKKQLHLNEKEVN
ncbi:MAG TPA: hypothetical protein VK135_03820 [Candidatus Dormibacteraeota bacterium]|nr:hypothetical protein [Candidatus Dormibacteraeota bacterium]